MLVTSRPCRHAGQSSVKKNYKKTPDICPALSVVRCPVHLKKTHICHIFSMKIQIKSEITPDAAGQNAGLSGVTAGSCNII